MSAGYHEALRSLMRASAGAYGYTLSVWSGGAALSHLEGPPEILDAALFLAGSVAGFVLLEALATRLFRESGSDEPQLALQMAATLHFISAGIGLGAAALAAVVLDGLLAWPLGGCTLTAAYFATAAAQLALVRRRTNRR